MRGVASVVICLLASAATARAETLMGAMRRAYDANPQVNASRAELRAIDERVPQAQAGMRPRVTGDGYLGVQRNRLITKQRDVVSMTRPIPPTRKTSKTAAAFLAPPL